MALLVKTHLGSKVPFILIMCWLLIGAFVCGIVIGVLLNWYEFGEIEKNLTPQQSVNYGLAY